MEEMPACNSESLTDPRAPSHADKGGAPVVDAFPGRPPNFLGQSSPNQVPCQGHPRCGPTSKFPFCVGNKSSQLQPSAYAQLIDT